MSLYEFVWVCIWGYCPFIDIDLIWDYLLLQWYAHTQTRTTNDGVIDCSVHCTIFQRRQAITVNCIYWRTVSLFIGKVISSISPIVDSSAFDCTIILIHNFVQNYTADVLLMVACWYHQRKSISRVLSSWTQTVTFLWKQRK